MKLYRWLPLALATLTATGCSSSSGPRPGLPRVVPARGVVRYNGQPLAGATVTFTNTSAQVAASGLTDADGRFTLTTFTPGDGAVPGKHLVVVTKVESTGQNQLTDKSAAPVFRPGGAPPPHRWVIPQRYANPQTSGLTADISESGDNNVALELKGTPGS